MSRKLITILLMLSFAGVVFADSHDDSDDSAYSAGDNFGYSKDRIFTGVYAGHIDRKSALNEKLEPRIGAFIYGNLINSRYGNLGVGIDSGLSNPTIDHGFNHGNNDLVFNGAQQANKINFIYSTASRVFNFWLGGGWAYNQTDFTPDPVSGCDMPATQRFNTNGASYTFGMELKLNTESPFGLFYNYGYIWDDGFDYSGDFECDGVAGTIERTYKLEYEIKSFGISLHF